MLRLTASACLAALIAVNPTSSPVAVTDRNPADLHRQTLSGVAWVVMSKPALATTAAAECEATAFVADSRKRFLVTNFHVVDSAKTLRVFFPVEDHTGCVVTDRTWYDVNQPGIVARVVAANPLKDLAIIQVAQLPRGVKQLKLATAAAIPGEAAHCVGAAGPRQHLWVCSNGSVGAVFQLMTQDGSFSGRVFETSIPAGPGSSGSPVLNAAGEVLGVVFARRGHHQRAMSLIVDATEVRALLELATREATPSAVPEVAATAR